MTAFNVYLKGKLFDTVFYDSDMTSKEVRDSLIGHDGYHPYIVVRRN